MCECAFVCICVYVRVCTCMYVRVCKRIHLYVCLFSTYNTNCKLNIYVDIIIFFLNKNEETELKIVRTTSKGTAIITTHSLNS